MNVATHAAMRRENRKRTLDCIRRNGPIAKRGIQRLTGMSWAAISGYVNELSEEGYVQPVCSKGKSVLYSSSGEQHLCLGIDVAMDELELALIDLGAEVLRRHKQPLTGLECEDVMEQMTDAIQAFAGDALKRHALVGIGVALTGLVQREEGISVRSPYFKGWHEVPVKQRLEAYFQIPVLVEHDPDCMAYAVLWHRNTVSSMLFIRFGLGLGLSMVLGGQMYHSQTGSAELGHIHVPGDGRECLCGHTDCLETYVSIRGIAHSARQYEGPTAGTRTDIELFEQVCARSAEGDAQAKAILEDASARLAEAVGNLAIVLTPQVILFGGMGVEGERSFLEHTASRVRSLTEELTLCVACADGASSAAEGVAMMVADGFCAYLPDKASH